VIVHIPKDIVEAAIDDAKATPQFEIVGFFAIDADQKVSWERMTNVHPSPENTSEVAASEMFDMIMNRGLHPVAMFHSHPSGDATPSPEDMEFFPGEYVINALIWAAGEPGVVTRYTPNAYWKRILTAEIFVVVNA
jgi:proteasome lid subunit RPN8/RPN11